MSKLRVWTTKEVETEYDLPVFLHYQDEMDYPTFIKIEEVSGKILQTTVSRTYRESTISKEYDAIIAPFNKRSVTTEQYFNDALNDALADFKLK